MYNYKIKKQSKEVIEINLTIPKDTIILASKRNFEKLRKNLFIPGFRKGKVPKDVAEKHISKDQIYQEVIKDLLPKIYQEIIKKERIVPIVNPKIELVKAKENEDWQINILVAEKPKVNLKNYKEVIKKVKADEKKTDIWVPGKDKKEPTIAEKEQKRQQLLNKVLDKLLKTVDCEIADIVIEEELNRRLTQLLDDIQKLGLTVENYLKSKNITYDQLKTQYQEEIKNTYKLEFILQAIADTENVQVNDEDLNKLFNLIKDEKQKKAAQQNAYFYASILRKQKTLDLLMSL